MLRKCGQDVERPRFGLCFSDCDCPTSAASGQGVSSSLDLLADHPDTQGILLDLAIIAKYEYYCSYASVGGYCSGGYS